MLLVVSVAGCARGALPIATTAPRPGASALGTAVLGETIVPLTDGSRRAPLQVEEVDPSRRSDAPVYASTLGVRSNPGPQPGRSVQPSGFPFAPSPLLPSIEEAGLTCAADGLQVWIQSASHAGELSVQAAVRLPSGAQQLLFVAETVQVHDGLTHVSDWGSFPGDPSERPDLLGAVCTSPTWPVTVTIQDDEGNELRAALDLLVTDQGWVTAHLDDMAPMTPSPSAPLLTTPWIDPRTGFTLLDARIVCRAGVPRPEIATTFTNPAARSSLQWIGLAAAEDATTWTSAAGSLRPSRLTPFDAWASGAEPSAEICDATSWSMYVRLFDGEAGVFEALVDAPVVSGD